MGISTFSQQTVNTGLANPAGSGNAIINGAFDIWQRGTSFSSPASSTYTADRSLFTYNGSGAAYTISRETNPAGSLIGTDEPEFFYRFNQTTAGTGATAAFPWVQRVENARTFAGKTVTFSAYIKTNSPRTASFQISFGAGSGGSGVPSALISPNFTTTNSWERYTFTTTIPSFSGATLGVGNFMSAVIRTDLNVTQTFDIWGVQLEAGAVATPFRRNADSLQGELAACQRYYIALNPAGNTNYPIAFGFCFSTTSVRFGISVPVEMRSVPTITAASGYSVIANGTSSTDPVISSIATRGSLVVFICTVTGYTTHHAAAFKTSASFELSAKL